MDHNFSRNLRIFLPYLATFSPEYAYLQNIANQLPIVDQGGFEIHAQNHSQIDIQLCIRYQNIKNLIAQHLMKTSPWLKIYDFIEVWRKEIKEDINEIWLETDSDAPANASPAIFFGIKRDSLSTSIVKKTIAHALKWISPEYDESLLNTCIDCCPASAQITYVGVMLSRSTKVLRVNIRGLDINNVPQYLHDIGWQGNLPKLRALISWIFTYVDRVTIAIDIGENVMPKVGIECFIEGQEPQKWTRWLDALVKKELCNNRYRDLLLAWPGVSTPINSSPWPEHFVWQSLCSPANVFSTFSRQLSHIKLTYCPDLPVTCKGYLWFHHEWRTE